MRDHCLQILSGATVSETQYAIGLAATTSRIPRYGIPAALHEGIDHAQHVMTFGIAFQPVSEHRHALRTVLRPIQIKEIAVWSFDALAAVRHKAHSAYQTWP